MARGVAPILLMTSLGAALLLILVAAGAVVSAAAVPDDAIRLPTDTRGMAGLATAMASAARGGEERPWGECCDLAMCTKSFPPICRCLDKVDSCSSACEHCEETEDESSRTCADWYKGDPGPQCHHDGAAINRGGVALAAERQEAAAMMAAADDEMEGGGGDEKRPWKCCSLPVCTRSWPRICHCFDEVKRCSRACERCEKVEGSGSGYRCLDTHRGDPGPKCEEDKAAGWWPPAVASRRYRF